MYIVLCMTYTCTLMYYVNIVPGSCSLLTYSCLCFDQVVNQSYKTNLMKLKNFVMVQFNQDTMVDPKETEVRKSVSLRFERNLLCMNDILLFLEDIYNVEVKM